MAKTMEELDLAMENHGARAAIAIFSRAAHAPTSLPFTWWGNRAVLVFDKDAPDLNALRLAYAWARWTGRRDLTADKTSIDTGRVEAAFSKARQALAKHQAVRSCHTAARNKIDEAASHVTTLVDEVRAALTELAEVLGMV